MVEGSTEVMGDLTKIAIILPFNDLEVFHGGSRQGVKSKISYFEQFLILYESILDNWKKKVFDYQIIVLHSVPFSMEKRKILDCLDICVKKVDYDGHPLKIRPMAYMVEIECDFRLVLDVDMIALREPEFDFRYDAQAVYGGNKYNKKQWQQICRYLDCAMPSYKVFRIKKGLYGSWSFNEHYLYQAGLIKKNIFPYFNNGAVLVKNSMASKLVDTWVRYRDLYTEYIKVTEGVDIDLEGQDVMGLAISNITDNWSHLPRGCNYAINERFYLGRRLIASVEEAVSLFHYINITEGNHYYDIVDQYLERITEKYRIGSKYGYTK